MTQGSAHPSALGSWRGQLGMKGGAIWALAALVLEGQVPWPFRPASSLCPGRVPRASGHCAIQFHI